MDANWLTINNKSVNFVSIHAPVMDAKLMVGAILLNTVVSIHAPVMDANNYS